MKNLKKIAASVVAATAVVSSIAVTASADFKIEGNPQADGNKYSLTVWGIPEEALKHSEFQMQFLLDDDETKFLVLNGYLGGVSCEATISVVRKDDPNRMDAIRKMTAKSAYNLGTQKRVFIIEFDKDDEYLAEIMKRTNLQCVLTADDNDSSTLWLDSDGNVIDSQVREDYFKNVALDLKPLSSTSEPTSSEPTSAPASEPASSTPASEPAASVPESTAASSESAAQQNPVTGVGGITLTFAAAAIAAGAVIVARKKK